LDTTYPQGLVFDVQSAEAAVAEIPEHLLARSKAKRAAAGGGDGGSAASAPAAASSTTPGAEVAAAPAAAVAKAPKAETAVPGPVIPVVPKGQAFSRITKVMLMAGLPVWAFFYAGIFATPKSTTETIAEQGGRLFAGQCASCHNANGSGKEGGGVGRPLWKGQVELTFPKIEEQIAFVRHGSCEKGVAYGNPKREGGEHKALTGMPAFAELTDQQIWAIMTYERTVLSEKPWPVPTAEEVATGVTVPIPTSVPATTEAVCRP
jgi:mono/diheme cytochrome c family protein